MQRAAVQRHPQQRKAGGAQAPSKLVDRAHRRLDPPRFADEPRGDALDTVVGRPFGRRALEDTRRDDVLALDKCRPAAGFVVAHRLGPRRPNSGSLAAR